VSERELYQDALEVRILTAVVAREARQDIEGRLKAYGFEMTALQYRVLRQLQQYGRLTIKELSQSCMVEPATLVPVIDTLERQSIIRRGQDPHDRRRTPIELTEQGVAQLGAIPFEHEDDVIVRYLRQLSDEERRAFVHQLRELVTMIHGHDTAVSRITQAVESHFSFGEQQSNKG
jgi:DNA-binding MarR family transcriptional regulator